MKNDFNKIINETKALLLDLDGTLINSEKAFYKSFKNILSSEYGIDITEQDYKKYELDQNAMLLKTLKIKKLISESILESDIMSKIYSNYENEFRKIILEEEAVNNFELLKQIKELGVIVALVSTCRRYYINILSRELELEDLFDVIVAREDVKELKPSPEAYIMALDALKLNKEDCLSIEDSKRGVDSAIACGLKTVKVDNFTSIKYEDDRTIEFDSANEVLKNILTLKQK